MSMKMTITTRGVKGAPMLLREFTTNLPRVIGSRPLEEYAANVAEQMIQDAPVDTGYLRANIRSYRIDPTTVSVTSWAPYSGYAEIYSHRPYYFSNNTFNSQNIGAQMLQFEAIRYLQILINKYQNLP